MATRRSVLIPDGRNVKLDDLVRRKATMEHYIPAMIERENALKNMYWDGLKYVDGYFPTFPTPLAASQFAGLVDEDDRAVDPNLLEGGDAPHRLRRGTWYASDLQALKAMAREIYRRYNDAHAATGASGSELKQFVDSLAQPMPAWYNKLSDVVGKTMKVIGTAVSGSKLIGDALDHAFTGIFDLGNLVAQASVASGDDREAAQALQQAHFEAIKMENFWRDKTIEINKVIAKMESVNPSDYDERIRRDIDQSWDERIFQLRRRGIDESTIQAVIRGHDVDEEAAVARAKASQAKAATAAQKKATEATKKVETQKLQKETASVVAKEAKHAPPAPRPGTPAAKALQMEAILARSRSGGCACDGGMAAGGMGGGAPSKVEQMRASAHLRQDRMKLPGPALPWQRGAKRYAAY